MRAQSGNAVTLSLPFSLTLALSLPLQSATGELLEGALMTHVLTVHFAVPAPLLSLLASSSSSASASAEQSQTTQPSSLSQSQPSGDPPPAALSAASLPSSDHHHDDHATDMEKQSGENALIAQILGDEALDDVTRARRLWGSVKELCLWRAQREERLRCVCVCVFDGGGNICCQSTSVQPWSSTCVWLIACVMVVVVVRVRVMLSLHMCVSDVDGHALVSVLVIDVALWRGTCCLAPAFPLWSYPGWLSSDVNDTMALKTRAIRTHAFVSVLC